MNMISRRCLNASSSQSLASVAIQNACICTFRQRRRSESVLGMLEASANMDPDADTNTPRRMHVRIICWDSVLMDPNASMDIPSMNFQEKMRHSEVVHP